MATIPFPGGLIRHVRKTIAFDGGAGSGQKDSPITVFGLTGEVLLIGGASGVLLRCTETFVGAALANTVLADADGEWATDDMAASAGEVFNPSEFNWIATNIVPVVAFGGSGNAVLLSDYTLTPVDGAGAAAAITDGTLRVHAWYIPLTDDGALAGDDIDIEMDDYIAAAVWAAGTRTLTAIDEDSTTLDLDATIRGAVGLAAADLDTQLGALPTAAENADAVWDEAATGHTDAGKAGEQLWTDVDAILTDTATTLQGELDAIQAAVITNAAGVDIAADIIALKAETAAILADTNELQTDDYPTSIADIEGKVDDLEGRLTATRAGYLDNLSAGAVALEATAQSILTDTGTTLDNLVDDLESRLGTPSDLGSGATVAANLADIKGETAAILDDTDLIDDGTSGLAKIATDVAAILVDTGTTLQGELDGIQADTEDIQTRLPAALVGGRIDATVDATGMETGAIDAILTRAMTESYNTDGSTMTVAQALYLITQRLTEFAISGTTVTVKKLDGSTTALTLTLDDASDPTSTTRAS